MVIRDKRVRDNEGQLYLNRRLLVMTKPIKSLLPVEITVHCLPVDWCKSVQRMPNSADTILRLLCLVSSAFLISHMGCVLSASTRQLGITNGP